MKRELAFCVALCLLSLGYAAEDGGGGGGPDEGGAPKAWDDDYAKKQMDRYFNYFGKPAFDHKGCKEACKEEGEDGASSKCMRKCGDKLKTCLRQNCFGAGDRVATNQPRCYWWHGCRQRMCKCEEDSKKPNCPELPE